MLRDKEANMRITSFLRLTTFAVALFGGIVLCDLATRRAASAQEKPKVGVLFGGPKGSAAITAFVKAIEELGYQDGTTIALDFRYADGKPEQLQVLAKELSEQNPKVIVGVASDAVIAAAKATSTVPIVSASGDVDFVGMGLAKSLEKPDGNVTGVAISGGEAAQLRVALLKKAVPALSTLVVLTHPSNSANQRLLAMMEEAAGQHGVKLQPVSVTKPEDLEAAIIAAKAAGVQAVSSLQGPFFFFQRKLLSELSEKHGMPLGMGEPLSADAGALLQVNPDIPGAAASSAKYVDRILKGARAGDLAIERHRTIQIVLNMKVARALNLHVDPAIAKDGRIID
jgi:putative ABC transport system substrate-binding protein